jgi:hypothetical protein
MADSPFQRAARQRWPRYTTWGDGEWAVVCPVVQIVTLYDFAMLANVEMHEPHSNWGCAEKHKLERIKPAYEATTVILKSPADIERDD